MAVHYQAVPVFTVDLDLPPAERWREVVEAYAKHFVPLTRRIERDFVGVALEQIPFSLGFLLYHILVAFLGFICWIDRFGWFISYSQELVGVSKYAGIPLGKVVVLQFLYEASTLCTSIVVQDAETGRPVHLRTMDWEMSFDLRPVTVTVDFMSKGKRLFSASTWAGYVGVLTGMRYGMHSAYSVSVNYRTSDGMLTEQPEFNAFLCFGPLRRLLALRWSTAATVRHVMETQSTFEGAVQQLQTRKLVAPCYFIVAGSEPGEGIGISRTPDASLNPQLLSSGPVVQVNNDHWECNPLVDIMDGKQRISTARRMLRQAAAGPLLRRWEVISAQPVRNDITVYGCVMVPSEGFFQCGANTSLPIDGVWTPYTDGRLLPSNHFA